MMTYFYSSIRGRCPLLQKLALFALLLLGVQSAWAASNCSGGGTTTTVTMPATITVPRDAPAGTVLVPWVISGSIGTFTCDFSVESVGTFALPTLSGGSLSAQTYDVGPGPGPSSYKVYQTQVPGIGIAVAFNAFAAGCGYMTWKDMLTPDGGTRPLPWVGWGCTNQEGPPGTVVLGGQFAVAVIKTGPVSTAGVIGGDTIGQATLGVNPGSGFVMDLPGTVRDMLNMSPVAIVPSACTTPDVVVALGKHMQTEFTGVDSTSRATSFSISLNGCPAGMTGIEYRIDPVTTVVNNAQSVVALDGSSSARGVGVQLLDSTGTAPFPLGQWTRFNEYDPATGGSYSIPLKARYYQTDASIGVGTANTSMTFTMTYE